MNTLFSRLLPLVLGYAWLVSISEANEGYLVMTPSVFYQNREEVISITILKPSEPIYVEVKLFSKTGDLIAESGHELFGKGTLKLKVPKNTKGHCTLKICGNCVSPREGSYTFYNSSSIIVEEKGSSVFIQTDRPVYKPSQKVLINVITVGPDLKPVNEKLLVYIEDPRGTKMVKWKNRRPLCCGLLNMSYPLSDRSVHGKWMIFVELQGQVYNKSFEIQKYVLPKFQVAIYPPAFVRDWNKCDIVYVRARYLYDKAVRGQLSANIMVKGVGYYNTYSSPTLAKIIPIDGLAMFNVCISDLMTYATDHFRGKLLIEAEVTTADGSTVKVSDASCAVNKHLVDLEFTKDTRRHFKPGLPYRGKLSVYYPDGTAADNVTVAVASRVDGKDYAAQEFLSSKGVVNFYVTPIPTSSSSVWIDAKVLRIQEEDVGQQYVPVYLSVSNWYSPSECHVLVEGNANINTLMIGDEARFQVHSSCPCNFTMFYEVMSRGNLVHSGIHFASHSRNKRSADDEQPDQPEQRNKGQITFAEEEDVQVIEEREYGSIKVCTIYVKFTVTHAMAPFSRLLVYYVRENGEGVADSFMFNVEPSYKNPVSIELSKRNTLPGDHIQMHVNAKPDSCVCIGAVDKSVHLLKPGYQLSTEEIFQEMESYDISVPLEEDFHVWGWASDQAANNQDRRRRRRRRRSVPWWQAPHARDAQFAFEECGLLVMTDSVQLHFRQQSGSNTDPIFWNPWRGHGYHQVAEFTSSQRELKSQYKAGERHRTYFPETWMWTCFNISATRNKFALDVQVPDGITAWHVDGLSISSTLGLALAEPVQLTTFKHFFLDFTVPYAVVRGEQVKIPLTIHNYLRSCVRVHLNLELQDGVHYVQDTNSIERLCVGAEETKTLSPLFVFSGLGWQNISAQAAAYQDNLRCSGVLSADDSTESDPVGQDSVQHSVLCEAEGLPQSYTLSTYICPNERLYVSTPNRYEFQYVNKPLHMTQFSFATRASNDARLALTTEPSDNDQMYEIVLGGWSNTQSWIAQGKEGEKLVTVNSTGVVSGQEFRSFWISWHNGHIEVGYGDDPTRNDSLLMSHITNRPLYVEYVGFSTGWGAEGSFKIWTKSEEGTGLGEMFNLGLPMAIVPGSEKATVTITGDVMGPTRHNLHRLLKLPSGCGEQNMIHFAPNVFVLNYLDKTGQLTEEVKEKAYNYLVEGYQKQLTFRREDGSYSAFGERDASGNVWLTAFVLKSFAQAKGYVFIDQSEITSSMMWIMDQQRTDGSFPALGRLINKDLQGGVQGSVALTAYIVTAFLEVGVRSKLERTSLRGAQKYLENHTHLVSDPYTAALTSYALTLLHSERAGVVVKILKQMAIKRGGLMYWTLHGEPPSEQTLLLMLLEELPENKVPSAEVEIAAYSLLTYVSMGDVAAALPIVKWLSKQRNALGGFSSTQDTCVALHALSEYASLAYTGPVDGTVTLASTNMDLQELIMLHENNSDVAQTVEVPSLPTELFVIVDAAGEGCVLVQVDVNYNLPNPSEAPSFDLEVRLGKQRQKQRNRTKPLGAGEATASSAEQEEQDGGDSDELDDEFRNELDSEGSGEFKVTVETCTKWLRNGSSNMAVLEVALLTGFRPDVESLDRLLQHRHLQLKMYEIQGRKILFYFDEVRNDCLTCISFEAYRMYIVGKTQPVPVKVYDYYEPAYESSQFYNVTHIGELIQDLCEDELCNEIKQDVTLPESSEDCNSIFGCYGGQGEDVGFCTCYRDCQGGGPEVCASDGLYYSSHCVMKVEACQQDVYLESMPLDYCEPLNVSLEIVTDEWDHTETIGHSAGTTAVHENYATMTTTMERSTARPLLTEVPNFTEVISENAMTTSKKRPSVGLVNATVNTEQQDVTSDEFTLPESSTPSAQSASVTEDDAKTPGGMVSSEWLASETTELPVFNITDYTVAVTDFEETDNFGEPYYSIAPNESDEAEQDLEGENANQQRAEVKLFILSPTDTGPAEPQSEPNITDAISQGGQKLLEAANVSHHQSDSDEFANVDAQNSTNKDVTDMTSSTKSPLQPSNEATDSDTATTEPSIEVTTQDDDITGAVTETDRSSHTNAKVEPADSEQSNDPEWTTLPKQATTETNIFVQDSYEEDER